MLLRDQNTKGKIVGQLHQEGHQTLHQSNATDTHVVPVMSGVVASLLVP